MSTWPNLSLAIIIPARTQDDERQMGSLEQYVVGAVHTQTIEGFWSIIKRGIVGSFHKVVPQVFAVLRRRIPIPLQ
jgi:hypothetical protein